MKFKTVRNLYIAVIIAAIGGCVATQPAYANELTVDRFCHVTAEFATTVAVLHESGIPLKQILAETTPDLHPTVRAAYTAVTTAPGADEAERASFVGRQFYVACLIKHSK